MAAAAASSSSRGVAGGLYILFTLLCLVCLASSWIDDDKLKMIKESIQKTEQNLDYVKASQSAQRATISELMSQSKSTIDAMMAFAEKFSAKSPDDSLPLKGILESARRLVEKSKTYVDEQNELLDAEIADVELNVGELKKALRAREENQAEL